MIPNNSRNLCIVLSKVMRRDYAPAIAAQLNQANLFFSRFVTPATAEERAAMAAERAAEQAQWQQVIDRTRTALRDMPDRLRQRLLDEFGEWDD